MKKYANSTLQKQTKEWLIKYIRCLEKSIESCEECNNRQFNLLIEKDMKMQSIIILLEELEKEHKYKIYGKAETYSQYNEAWQDCIDRAIGIVKGGAKWED